MANQFSQHHVSSLPHWFKLPPFSLSQFPHMFLFRFHWLVCLFLCQGHNALNAVASWYILISGSIKNPFLIFQTPFLEISWLFFILFSHQVNHFESFCHVTKNNLPGIFIVITEILQSNWRTYPIFPGSRKDEKKTNIQDDSQILGLETKGIWGLKSGVEQCNACLPLSRTVRLGGLMWSSV